MKTPKELERWVWEKSGMTSEIKRKEGCEKADDNARKNLIQLINKLKSETYTRDGFYSIVADHISYLKQLNRIRNLLAYKKYAAAEDAIAEFVVYYNLVNISVRSTMIDLLTTHLSGNGDI